MVQVDKDSPAGRAGIHAADTIQSFNGKPISDELSLRMAISSTTPGATVPVVLIRDGQSVNLNVTVAAPPSQATTAKTDDSTPAPPKKIGLSVRNLTPSDRDQMGLDPSVQGAFVTAVLSNSPAERAHLTTSDVITRIGKSTITTADEAAQALVNLKPGATTTVIITRVGAANKVQEIALELRLWQ